jgi:hypothetical protein
MSGKLDEAEKFLRDALRARRRFLGERHSQTLCTLRELAGCLEERGKPEEAAELLQSLQKAR